ncbi:histone-arginine methyltransferase CARM1-like [Takifugu rubripes]|uniref:histone-arginine methyltransferase CARM1-like n=1 Tax=Takifugu rubripes TaxID=31033 RepID=UPI0005D213B3|nr:histone-arginine methyltransferase CARM1-like [Takifugu rubripes]XP_056883399.1 histone-arginine methyltransferase CARM1-like isoform X2 [Takifugu flavidus]|eukprot:XP_011604349.1 PREDICTED: histone-arginine methyltransferase CARM1-like isoform X2 [Takifugu rubripes]
MEEKSKEPQRFSVRVFTLQEEQCKKEELHIPEEVRRVTAEKEVNLYLTTQKGAQQLKLQDGNRTVVLQLTITAETGLCQVGGQSFLVTVGHLNFLLRFKSPADMKRFQLLLRNSPERSRNQTSRTTVFKTLKSSPAEGYQFHSCLLQQQTLLQDSQRISIYQRAILANEVDFRGKAGATRVYAVESKPMAQYTQILVDSNCLSERITVLEGEAEEVICPDMVDVIISEPMGYMLLGDTLMGSFMHARKWLKPNGLMFPSSADIHLAPFSDEQLYTEHCARASFWQQRSFYGVDLAALHSPVVDEFLKQPIVDAFDVHILVARSVKHRINFVDVKDLNRMEIPFAFTLLQSGVVHGLAFWFDVAYAGSKAVVWLSTAPSEPLTRWCQVRCLLQAPLFAKAGETLSGRVLLAANDRESYDIHIKATVDQSNFTSGNILDLKNPFFRLHLIPP